MANSPFNQMYADPELKDVLDYVVRYVFLSLNCHAVARIQSFNAVNQTVTATINYKKVLSQRNPATSIYENVLSDYPVLVDMPVLVLGGGGGYVSFPISAGDDCLVLFNDRDIDTWFQNVTTQEPPSNRLHSFSDGIAIVGLRSTGKFISDYDTSRAMLYGPGGAKVGANDKVLVGNDSTTLNTLLAQLIDNLKSLVTQVAAITVTGVTSGSGASGPPSNASEITAISTDLTNTANAIAGLLE